MSESPLMRQIRLALTPVGTRLFRNNVAQAWVGRIIQRTRDRLTLQDPRPLHAGLCVGSSDLIGWHPVTITPDMVGRTLAVFCAVETKTETGRPSEEQLHFLHAVETAGGIACLARSPEEVGQKVLSYSQHLIK